MTIGAAIAATMDARPFAVKMPPFRWTNAAASRKKAVLFFASLLSPAHPVVMEKFLWT